MRRWRVILAVAVTLPAGFYVLFFLWPVASLIITGVSGPDGMVGALSVFEHERTWRAIGQTFVQATLATILSIVLGIPAAFTMFRLTFPGQRILRAVLTVPFVLPTVVVGTAFSSLYGPGGALHRLGLDRSLTVVVLALTFFNVTLVMRVVGGFWASLDPRPADAATMLGASPWRVFRTVTLPQLTPAIGASAALVLLFCSTAFGVVLVLGGSGFANTEMEIYRLTVQFLDLQGAAVLAIVQGLIVAVAIYASHRLRLRSERALGITGAPAPARRPTRVHVPAICIVVATFVLLHLLPLLALVARSLRTPDGEFSLQHYRYLVVPPEESPLRVSALNALTSSMTYALIATVCSLLLGTLIALVVSRRPRARRWQRAIALFEGAIMLPIGVSAVTIGLGLLLTMHRPLGIGLDLRSSAALIPIAQMLIALPLVVRTLTPALRAIPPQTLEAAMMLGASPLRVFRTIELPVLGRNVGLAAGFAFAIALGEFGATVFLVRGAEQTLPVAITQLVSHQAPSSYGTGLAAAILLGVITTTAMMLAESLRVRGGGPGRTVAW